MQPTTMGQGSSSPKEKRTEMKSAPVSKAPFLTRGSSGKTSSEATGRLRWSGHHAHQHHHHKSLNLPFLGVGKEESADEVESKSTASTKGSPDYLELHLPSRSLKQRDGLDECDDDTDTRNCFPSSGGAPLLSFVTPRTWFGNNSHSGHSTPSTQKSSDNETLDALPSVSSLLPPKLSDPQANTNQPQLRSSSTSVPVKCPSPRSKHNQATFHAQELDQQHPSSFGHLQNLYDSRTWDMFLRITEARKKQRLTPAHDEHGYLQHQQQPIPLPLRHTTMIPTGSTPPPSEIDSGAHFGYGHYAHGDEAEHHHSSIPIEVGGVSSSGHEMMFDLE